MLKYQSQSEYSGVRLETALLAGSGRLNIDGIACNCGYSRDSGHITADPSKVSLKLRHVKLTQSARHVPDLVGSTQTVLGGNYVDINTGLEYWVSGPKRNGKDRHWAGGGDVQVESDVVDEYWRDIRRCGVPDNPFVT